MTPRDRTMVIGLALLAVLAGVWFGLVSPRRAALHDLRQQNAAARTQRDAAVSQAAAGLAAKRAYTQNLAALAALGKAVPAKDDTASLLYELQDAAGHARVTLTGVTPGGAAAGASTPLPVPTPTPAPAATPTATGAAPAGAQVVPISLTFQGEYTDLQRFLRHVEAFARFHGNAITVHGRLLAVNSIALTTTPPTKGVTATITATTYVASAPATTTTAPAPGATAPPASSAGSATPSTAPAAVLGGAG